MITPEDLPVVPVLASVAPEDLARLAQTAGDVRLGAGDYAVHEGDERALFVVLAGRIEVTKSSTASSAPSASARRARSSARCRSSSARRTRAATGPPNPRA